MFGSRPIAKQELRISPIGSQSILRLSPAERKPTPYAIREDFCQIFDSEMDCLYLLSFLLTANHSLAEECFVRGLEDSAKSNRVFKDWARSWARRKVIQSAIQLIRPRPTSQGTPSFESDRVTGSIAGRPEIAAIVELPEFDRFVLVMSVLESYSDEECALLLHSTRSEVMAARTGALQRIAWSADEQRRQDEAESTSGRKASHLAA